MSGVHESDEDDDETFVGQMLILRTLLLYIHFAPDNEGG